MIFEFDDYREPPQGCGVIFGGLCFIVIAAVILLLTSCTSPKVVTVTEYRDRVERDTLTQVDSIYVSHIVRERGDTVYMADTIYKFKYLDKYKYIHVRDSVPYPVEVQVPVRVRNGYDRFVSWGFWIFVVLILIRLGWWAFKKFYLHR